MYKVPWTMYINVSNSLDKQLGKNVFFRRDFSLPDRISSGLSDSFPFSPKHTGRWIGYASDGLVYF